MECNASGSLNLLCLGLERKVKCYNGYIFHTKKYVQDRKTYNSEVCVKGSILNEFEVDYFRKLEEVIEL
jgi:hypothetical protein